MTSDQRDIRRKLRILKHAEASGDVSKTCPSLYRSLAVRSPCAGSQGQA